MLLHIHRITNHPQFNLIKLGTPVLFVLFHPAAVARRVGRVNYELYKIIADEDTAVTPVAFNLLSLVTRGAKVIYDFQDCFGEQFGRYIASVIELKWEQDLESPPFAAHKWFCLLRRIEC